MVWFGVFFSKWLKWEGADGAPKILEVISATQRLGDCFYVKMAAPNPCQECEVFLTAPAAATHVDHEEAARWYASFCIYLLSQKPECKN